MIKKKYIATVCLIFCLTVTLLAILITTVGSQPLIPYDPWLDVNDDGIINILDLKRLKLAYGSSGDPTKNVTVTNFPTDDQGNLLTTTVQTRKIMLVYNQSLTVTSSLTNYIYLTSFNTSGFKHAYIVAKANGTWQVGAHLRIHMYDNNYGIQTYPSGARDITLQTASSTYPTWGTGASGKCELFSTITDLYLQVYNSDVGFDGLLTIVVHLTN